MKEKELMNEELANYGAVMYQRFVGTGQFEAVQQVVANCVTSTIALVSTETAQFAHQPELQL
jgi:hypothetical protein